MTEPWARDCPEVMAFAAHMEAPDGIVLDRACFQIAAAFLPDVDIARELGRLDELAAKVSEPTVDALVDRLFRVEQFLGDTDSYLSVDNSFLNRVLDRRLGIPITLSILTTEVGRRLGLHLEGVGMPAHFLVRDMRASDSEEPFLDPFSGGVRFGEDGCRQIYEHLVEDGAPFDPRWLSPAGASATLARVLANLKNVAVRSRDRKTLAIAARLRSTIADYVPISEHRELAEALSAMGHFDQAAKELEWAADLGEGELRRGRPLSLGLEPDEARAQASRLRASLN